MKSLGGGKNLIQKQLLIDMAIIILLVFFIALGNKLISCYNTKEPEKTAPQSLPAEGKSVADIPPWRPGWLGE